MSAYRFWTLTCDGCGEINDGGTSKTVTEARKVAESEGWVRKGREDLCPGCGRGMVRIPGFGWESR